VNVTAMAEEFELGRLLPSLESRLPQLVTEIVRLLETDFPDYAAELASDESDNLVMAQLALRRLVALAEQVPSLHGGDPTITLELRDTGSLAMFEEVGRIEWREGRELDLLLSAYRAGGRVAWRYVSEVAVERSVTPAAVALLAEAVFLFVEELSSASARGYVDEQRATAAERQRLRAQLAELLINGRSEVSVMRAIALRAGWAVPTTAAVVLVDPGREDAAAVLDRLEGQALPLRTGLLTGAVVAEPEAPGRRAALTRALAGAGAVVGSAVRLAQLPHSLRIAEDALRLRIHGGLAGDPVFVADHYDTVLVARDPWLLTRLREQVLAPLAGLPDATRGRLEETLAAWLAAGGDRRKAASLLQVHPQTVRYRLRQVTDCFGSTLEDPAVRLRLTLALCWAAPARPEG
jgi:hypothetical protein